MLLHVYRAHENPPDQQIGKVADDGEAHTAGNIETSKQACSEEPANCRDEAGKDFQPEAGEIANGASENVEVAEKDRFTNSQGVRFEKDDESKVLSEAFSLTKSRREFSCFKINLTL